MSWGQLGADWFGALFMEFGMRCGAKRCSVLGRVVFSVPVSGFLFGANSGALASAGGTARNGTFIRGVDSGGLSGTVSRPATSLR
jgi:hypothetical protein